LSAAIIHGLAALGRDSRLLLVGGLLGGLVWPQAAGILRPHLTELIVALLFFAALQVDPREYRLTRADLARDVALVLVLQLLLPVLLAGALHLLGWIGPAATMLVLIGTASTISGTPAIAQMLGLSASKALRLLVVGTLLLPLTSLVPLRMIFGSAEDFSIVAPALRLAGIILVSAGGAWLVRTLIFGRMQPNGEQAVGGITALLLAVFVLALMDAVQPALLADPWQVARALAFAFAVCVGLQVATALAYRRLAGLPADGREAGAVGVAAGNRNIALFLAALPASQMDPLMVLVGCYQIPMFLTPIVMRGFYRRLGGAGSTRSDAPAPPRGQ
jgi:arsenite transporter